jgi:hypothetical protein
MSFIVVKDQFKYRYLTPNRFESQVKCSAYHFYDLLVKNAIIIYG